MNWTYADLEAVEKAIALGVKRVEYHDKIVEYHSIKDLTNARRLILAALGLTAVRPTRLYASVRKGTYP